LEGRSRPAAPRVFLMVGSPVEVANARLLIESLRAFGGEASRWPVWVFVPTSAGIASALEGIEGTAIIPLEVPEEIHSFPFAAKVSACSRAEAMASGEGCALIWLSPYSLVIQPPLLLGLTLPARAAFRPVHIKNVGSPMDEPLDEFWRTIYEVIGLAEAPFTVDSLVNSVDIRPYFNTHLFAVDSSLGILRIWLDHFRALATNRTFLSGPCGDGAHRIFLHQAILSALIAKALPREQICILPIGYSYPLHFHREIPEPLRAKKLNDLVCPVYEDRYEHPAGLNGLPVQEPLDSWLRRRHRIT
jgi:hypothetical protein